MTVSSIPPTSDSPFIDVHVVARNATPRTLAKLGELGLDAKNVVGGDPRVRMEYLLSAKSKELVVSDELYAQAVKICENDTSFYGYIEQEVVSFDLNLESKGEAEPKLDISFSVSPCPDNLFKGCDLHFAFLNTPPDVLTQMKAHDFYHLVLNKVGLGDITIFTMQLEQVTQGFELWNAMLRYLDGVDGLACAAKFEVTRNLFRFGDYPLPPLVLKNSHPRFALGH
jgi:hypothetical protein